MPTKELTDLEKRVIELNHAKNSPKQISVILRGENRATPNGMKIDPFYIYRVLAKLQKKGLVKRASAQYSPRSIPKPKMILLEEPKEEVRVKSSSKKVVAMVMNLEDVGEWMEKVFHGER